VTGEGGGGGGGGESLPSRRKRRHHAEYRRGESDPAFTERENWRIKKKGTLKKNKAKGGEAHQRKRGWDRLHVEVFAFSGGGGGVSFWLKEKGGGQKLPLLRGKGKRRKKGRRGDFYCGEKKGRDRQQRRQRRASEKEKAALSDYGKGDQGPLSGSGS